MEHQVFLSYSRKDLTLMQRVRDDLRAEGLTVWTDEFLTPGTESWKDAIATAIENTGSLVVLLSPDAKKSEWVGREIDYALTQNVRIFPLIARGEDATAIPFVLIRYQYTNIRVDYAENFQKLLGALCDHLDIESKSQQAARLAHEKEVSLRAEQDRQRQEAERQQAQLLEEQFQKAEAELAQRQQAERERKERERQQAQALEQQRKLEKEQHQAQLFEQLHREEPSQTWNNEDTGSQPIHPATQLEYSGEVSQRLTLERPLRAWNPIHQFRLLRWLIFNPQAFVTYRQNADQGNVGAGLMVILAWTPLLIASFAFQTGGLNKVLNIIYYPINISTWKWCSALAFVVLLNGVFRLFDGYSKISAVLSLVSGLSLGLALSVVIGIAGSLEPYLWNGTFPVSPIVSLLLGVAFGSSFGLMIGFSLKTAENRRPVILLGAAAIFASYLAAFVIYPGFLHNILRIYIAISITYITMIGVAVAVTRRFRRDQSSRGSAALFALLPFSYAVLIWIYWLGGWHILGV